MKWTYTESGDPNAPLLIFVHGGGVGGWMWDRQVKSFQQYHCLVPELKESEDPKEKPGFAIERSARQLIDLAGRKGAGRPIYAVGFSLGAQIVIQMMNDSPHLLHGAMINSASVAPIPFAGRMIGPVVRCSFPLIRNRRFSALQAKALHIPPGQFETYYAHSLKSSPDALIGILRQSLTYRLPAGFSRSDARVLVTVGEKEKRVMHKSAEQLVSVHRKAQKKILPGVGHGIPLAQPECFNTILREWLEEGEERK
ncbi:alpha/beta fold hydrolase [Saccharibacillus endophyticus]|uniref:Hydrolase n=1 Tax=Saccharibacillus endophyticus TaxID=2060666 RepID=A0ABQ2A3A6_9BACL|nr:alpha/beta hydrolase [Saccharibacillus endophyticus]GGH84837.1 hydrolase [Saccharibacillus endophyticus]